MITTVAISTGNAVLIKISTPRWTSHFFLALDELPLSLAENIMCNTTELRKIKRVPDEVIL